MGSGKKNYRALRFNSRLGKVKKEEKSEEVDKKEPNKEDVDRLIALFQKRKSANK